MGQIWSCRPGQFPTAANSTKASIIYEATKDIRRVQLLLGHKWITSTQAYVGGDVAESQFSLPWTSMFEVWSCDLFNLAERPPKGTKGRKQSD